MEGSAPPDFRPLGIGEILDAAFKIYRSHFKTLVLCVLVVVVPMAILSTLVTASIDNDAFDLSGSASSTEIDGSAIGGQAAGAIIQFLLLLLATAACTRAVGKAYVGEATDWRESLGFAARKLGPLVLLGIVSGFLTVLGLFALLIGAIYVGIRLAVGSPVMLLEDAGPIESVKRSWKLVGGRWWATFGVLLITILLITILSGVLTVALLVPAFGDSDNELLGAILTTLGTIVTNVLTLPLQAAVVTIIYFDLRVRKEGFDIQMLADRMGGSGDAVVAGPSAGGPIAGLPDDRPDASSGFGGFAPPSAPERDQT